MRRTSALKKRIDVLLDDITSLRNIILSLCRAYNFSNDSVLMLIEQTLCQGEQSELAGLARLVEQHAISLQPQAGLYFEESDTHPFFYLSVPDVPRTSYDSSTEQYTVVSTCSCSTHLASTDGTVVTTGVEHAPNRPPSYAIYHLNS
jgi:hypothetical protein